MAVLPGHLASVIDDYERQIPPELISPNEDSGEFRHITVKYGLLTEDPYEVAEAVAGFAPFWIRTGKASVFHNKHENVLKVSVSSIDLVRLHREVCIRLDHVNTYRDFRPHITVAYLVKRDDDPYFYQSLRRDDLEGMDFAVNRLIFSTAAGKKFIIGLDGTVQELKEGAMKKIAAELIRIAKELSAIPMDVLDPSPETIRWGEKTLMAALGVNSSWRNVYRSFLTFREGTSNKFHFFGIWEDRTTKECRGGNAWGRIGYSPKAIEVARGNRNYVMAKVSEKEGDKQRKGYVVEEQG